MVKISKFTCEQNQDYCVTDNTNPRFNYIIESKENNVKISSIKLIVNNWEKEVFNGEQIIYDGDYLKPFTKYEAKLIVCDDKNNINESSLFLKQVF